MNISEEHQAALLIERASRKIDELQAELDHLKSEKCQPIAIVGLGCRFPGAENPEAYWNLLRNGEDAIREIPAERWNIEDYFDRNPEAPGKMYIRYGGFIDQIDTFDPEFFRISAREAVSLDPQQRLVLEVSWEALERAGLVGDALPLDTGVFIGAGDLDYRDMSVREQAEIDAYFISGNVHSTISGRLSYTLGLTGPSLAVDTACSSSLVSISLAVKSLRHNECSMAIAGGVQSLIAVENCIAGSKANMFSPDGRCKTFDALADGYARSEGCGIVVLKRLSDAIADGDHVLALVRGTAMNHDGYTSGLTVPSGPSQQAVIRAALADGQVEPTQVSYIEAHGTGTSLGDPIEMGALQAVFSQRSDTLIVGSAKTNIGHAEAAAGIAGLIKVVLAMQHKEIPPNLHFKQPSTHIDWEAWPVTVPTKCMAWAHDAERQFAGVSSFGFSGTNCHVVLESAPSLPEPQIEAHSAERTHHILTLSAKTPKALIELAERYAGYLANTVVQNESTLADICFTAHTGRQDFQYRHTVVADSHQQVSARLQAFADAGDEQAIASCVMQPAAKIAFVCTGQGSQYVGMAQVLYQTSPTFQAYLDRCDTLLQPELGCSLLDILYPAGATDAKTKIDNTAYTQAVLFAMEYALAQLWMTWGIRPRILLGHSVGELVAACLAGVFSLEDGLKLIAARGRLMQALPQDGSMVACIADEECIRSVIADYTDQVSIAAINGLHNIVISGAVTAVQAIVGQLNNLGVKTKPLKVSHAFHSPLMEPMLADFCQVAESITYHASQIPVISNVTGQLAGNEISTPDYWVRHVRDAVRFADGIQTVYAQGATCLLEIGPKPTLLSLARLEDASEGISYLSSLREGRDDWQVMLNSLGDLYTQGVKIDWTAFDQSYQRRKVILPTYPFQRERYWVQAASQGKRRAIWATPLIDGIIRSPRLQEIVCETRLSVERLSFLADHRVFNEIVSPGACQLAMVLEAVRLAYPQQALQLADVVFPQALVLADDKTELTIHTVFSSGVVASDETLTFELISFSAEQVEQGMQTHASGRLTSMDIPESAIDIAELRARCITEVDLAWLNARAITQQMQFGPAFRWLTGVWCDGETVLGRLQLPEAIDKFTEYQLHPALLDACLQLTSALQPMESDQETETLLPFALDSITLCGVITGSTWWGYAQCMDSQRWHIQLLDEVGKVLVQVTGFSMRAVPRHLISGVESWRAWLYEIAWRPQVRFGQVPTYFPNATTLGQTLTMQSTAWAQAADVQQQVLAWQQIDKLCVDYILIALDDLGLRLNVGDVWQNDQLIKQLSVIPDYHRLFVRLLAILGEYDILTSIGGYQWRVLQAPQPRSPQDVSTALRAKYSVLVESELNLLTPCAEHLSAVLRGTQDPLSLLFPDGDTSLVNQTYQGSPIADTLNRIIQEAIQRILAQCPAGQGIRILEVGGGTGGTTAGVLPLLPSDQTDYLFTDLGAGFFATAQEKFAEYPFVRYQKLDIEQSPLEQGVDLYQYDIVIAANVLHATKDLPTTLRHIQQVLQPGGVLLLLETTKAESWVDLTFGLTEGWWRFQDQRQTHPSLSTAEWEQLLLECGFVASARVLENDEIGQNVILGQTNTTMSMPTQTGRTWLVLADTKGMGEALAAELAQRGEQPILVYVGEDWQSIEAAYPTFYIRPEIPADYTRLLQMIPEPNGVLQLWGLDTPTGLQVDAFTSVLHKICTANLHLVQAVLNTYVTQPQLWLVTQGVQAILPDDRVTGILQSALWGLGKIMMLEHPESCCQCIDLDGNLPLNAQIEALSALVLNNLSTITAQEMASPKEQIALRHQIPYVTRLVAHEPVARSEPLHIHADATYLITGGLGGLGLELTDWLVEQGAGQVLLLGRSRPTAEVAAQIATWQTTGTMVQAVQVDVSQQEQVAHALAQVPADRPLRGIIHAAGLLDDGVLLQQNWEKFAKVLAPKVYGAWHLHALTEKLPLDFFVLFSSTTGLLGNQGQVNHAIANGYLDTLAAYRRAQQLPALSIAWGAWSEVGAAVTMVQREQAQMVSRGEGVIDSASGVQSFAYLLQQNSRHVGVMPIINWPKFLDNEQAQQPFFATLRAQHVTQAAEPGTTTAVAFRDQFDQAAPEQQESLLVQHIQQLVAQILGFDSQQTHRTLTLDTEFMATGMDSLMALELRRRLESSLQVSLRSTLVFEYPTIGQLVAHLLTQVVTVPESIASSQPTAAAPVDDETLDELSSAELADMLEQELTH